MRVGGIQCGGGRDTVWGWEDRVDGRDKVWRWEGLDVGVGGIRCGGGRDRVDG